MIRKTYYSNTKNGHNKDYLMVLDTDELTLTCTWGPIGGEKRVDRYRANPSELLRLEEEKNSRRLRNGYDVVSQNFGSKVEFTIDIQDMLEAEKI